MDHQQTFATPVTPAPCRGFTLRDTRHHFSRRFRLWRQMRGVPAKAVASDLDISRQTISSWETARGFPTLGHLRAVADLTGIALCRWVCPRADECRPCKPADHAI